MNNPTPAALPDPVEYPKITLGGEIFEVKFRSGDVIRLKKDLKIDLFEMGRETLTGIDALERTLTLLQAGISHQCTKTLEEIGNLVDLADVPRVAEAINKAISKAATQATAPQPEPPATAIQ
jgi:hypothetical protein